MLVAMRNLCPSSGDVSILVAEQQQHSNSPLALLHTSKSSTLKMTPTRNTGQND